MASQVLKSAGPLPQINIIALNSELVEAAKRVRVYVRSSGKELDRVVLWNFSAFAPSIPCLLYAFTVDDGNPELVMSIWKNDGTFTCEFGSQTGAPGAYYIIIDDYETWGVTGYFSITLKQK